MLEHSGSGYDLTTRYYDATGALVAVTSSTDYPAFCADTSFDIHYGPAMNCTVVETELICAKGSL